MTGDSALGAHGGHAGALAPRYAATSHPAGLRRCPRLPRARAARAGPLRCAAKPGRPSGLSGPPRQVDAREAYATALERLLGLPQRPSPDAAPTLTLARGPGLDVWKRYDTTLEEAEAPGARLAPIANWASKYAGRMARLASLLQLLETAWAEPWPVHTEGRPTTPVSRHAATLSRDTRRRPHALGRARRPLARLALFDESARAIQPTASQLEDRGWIVAALERLAEGYGVRTIHVDQAGRIARVVW